MRHFVLISLILTCTPLLWQPLRGQTPGVGKEASGNKKQDAAFSQRQPEPDLRGTKSAPLVVDTRGHINTPEETAKDKADEDHKSLIDGWTVGSAVAVAILTALLVIIGNRAVNAANRTLDQIKRQADLMDVQLKESRASSEAATALAHKTAQAALDTAESAKRSVEAIINSERAWVTVTPEQSDIETGVAANFFHHVFANKGKTVARIMEFNGQTVVIDSAEKLPDVPAYLPEAQTPFEFRHGGVMVPGQSEHMMMRIDEPITSINLQQIKSGVKTLYVYGFVRYFDFAEVERKNQFCYRYVDVEDYAGTPVHWVFDGPPDYNTHT